MTSATLNPAGFHYKGAQLCVDDLPLDGIARTFGTPLYVYSAARIRENFLAYDRAFAHVFGRGRYTICYATKANGHLAILDILRDLGAGADIVSGGELLRAQAAGIPASKTVFSGVGKSADEIDLAIKCGLCQINVESADEMELISKAAVKARKTVHIALRVNPDVDAKTHKKITTGKSENKFGIDIAKAPALYARARKLPGIIADGIAVHIGSQLTSLAPYRRAYRKVAALARVLIAQKHPVTRIDIGGGIGIRYKNETPVDLYSYALMVNETLGDLGAHLILEPGRSIVGDAGVLLAGVRTLKKGRNKTFAIIDAAMNDLLRPSLYEAYHALWPVQKRSGRAVYDVVGPVCETGDSFLTAEKLPVLRTGDTVALMCAGAYGMSMASNYNTRPFAAEVLVDGKKVHLIRARQTVESLLVAEKRPAQKTRR